jgi:coenzyme F420-reducing hydrogenase delta subunit
MKLQYDVTSRIIRMPCTARLDINFILKALQEGADGVLIVGCHPGDCAYKTGNLGAERRVKRGPSEDGVRECGGGRPVRQTRQHFR